MKKLTNDQREEIREIFEWGHFMKAVLKYKQDAGSNELSDEDIFLLIDAEQNLDLCSDYESEYDPCETCISHGNVSVEIKGKRFIMKEW